MKNLKICVYIGFSALFLAGAVMAKHHKTIITIVNLTDSELRLKDKSTSGDWDEKPAGILTNGATMSCTVTSDKAFEGHEVELEYTSTRGGSVWFKIRNTFWSGNHAYQSNRGVPRLVDEETGESTPLYFNRYGPGAHGDTVACTWILAWEDLTRTEGLPYDDINEKLRDSKKLLDDAGDTPH